MYPCLSLIRFLVMFAASAGFALVGLSGCSNSSNTQTSSTTGTNPAQVLPPGLTASDSVNSETGSSTTAISAQTSETGTVALTGPSPAQVQQTPAETPLTEKSAFRLLQQATFGPTEAGVTEALTKGPRRWLAEQFAMPVSSYGFRERDAIHRWNDPNAGFCDQFASGTAARDNCWRDWYSSDLIKLEFFKHASLGTDQLRQRIAFALAQIVVTSEIEVSGLYGLADYQQGLRDRAFGNYRDVLRLAATHPVMGQYLNMVDNDAADPNENFARELLQLFSIGTCALNADGSLKNGKCEASYSNDDVREYAFALTGWTYPSGGLSPWCTPKCGWRNPTYLKGAMEPVESAHDKTARKLLSGVTLGAGHTAPAALNAVLDSLMNHPNTPPFISRQLIQFLVSSNPSPAYVGRVSSAFTTGRYESFGSGIRGDLKATIAAILLDPEARDDAAAELASAGKMREPVILMVSAVRALNGYTDGERMGKYGWGSNLAQPVFNSPSVFNYYAPDYPLPGNSGMVAPQFQLVNANTTLGWSNYSNDLIYWWYGKGLGLTPNDTMVGSIGTRVSYAAFEADATDPAKLVDRLSRLLTGSRVGAAGRNAIVAAMNTYTAGDTWLTDSNNQSSWQRERVKTAAYLLIASPHFQVQR